MNPFSLRARLLPLVLTALCALAVPAASHAATPGVNIDAPTDGRVDAALSGGAKLVRLFVDWRKLEPSRPGEYPSSSDPDAAEQVRGLDSAIRRIVAGGARPILAVLGAPAWANGSAADQLVPPSDPGTYGAFFGRFVSHTQGVASGNVAAYEVWNEEDRQGFWHSGADDDVARYGPMLRAAAAAAAPVKGSAAILVGATTGNNATFIQRLYDAGLKGSFDGVAVHTDTACLSLGPDVYYREDPGSRIGQYSFLGYRAVRDVIIANGDGDAKIWMTEMGWSSTGGGPTSCTRGTGKGVRPDGVSEARQAAFLTQAYGCLAQDPYVVAGVWFSLFDLTGNVPDELNHYGLLSTGGVPKPAYAAFRGVAGADGGPAGPCGDFEAPTVSIQSPTPGFGFTGNLLIAASAREVASPGTTPAGLIRISFRVDGSTRAIGNYPVSGRRLDPAGDSAQQNYSGARNLSDGEHTITVTATDANGNVASASVKVYKGLRYAVGSSVRTRIVTVRGRNPSCRGRSCRFSGRLTAGGRVALSGRVRVQWQLLRRVRVRSAASGAPRFATRWTTFHKGGANARRPFSFAQKLARSGRWRVRAYYDGQAPLARTTTAWTIFRV